MFDVLSEPRCFLEDAVRVETVDHVFDCQVFCLLVFISCTTQNRTHILRKTAQMRFSRLTPEIFSNTAFIRMLKERLTDFSELSDPFVLVDATVERYRGLCGLLQQGVGRVGRVSVLLDGLQEERVTGDSLHRHHHEETQRGRF